METVTPEIIDNIEKALNSVRPFLQKDGGDVELVDVNEEFEVSIRLLGSCKNCLMSNMTMKNGIEESIKRFVPQVSKIVEIRD